MKKYLLACASTLALVQSAPALAQQPAAKPQAAPVEEIIVTGIRRSLEQAAEVKRESIQVMDVITAEDVGKLPDANVAEALQRVTGVQITRVFGEGQAVNVRGLQQVRVEVDGRTLLGWSARLSPPENDQLGRSSGLDSVPSGLFGRLEVRKSPLASDAEGGLSGTVNLVTPKPLKMPDMTASLRVSGTHSEGSGRNEPTVTGLFSARFFDDRLGLLLAGEYQKRSTVIQALERNNFLDRNYTSGTPAVTSVRQTPVLLQYENFFVDRSRLGLNGVLEFKVTDQFTLTADALYSELKTGRYQDFFSWRLPTGANPVTNAVLADNFVVAGNANGTLTTAGQIRNEPTESHLYGLNGTYESGPLKIVADGYYSRGTIDQSIQIITLQAAAAVPGSFDFRGGTIPTLNLGAFDPTNIANFNLATNGVRSNRLIGLLEEVTGKLDVGYALSDDFKVSGGLRYTSLRGKSNAYRGQTTPPRASILPYTGIVNSGRFLNDIGGTFPRVFMTTFPNYTYVYTTAQAAQPNPNPNGQSALLPNSQRDYELDEKTTAGYLMLEASHTLFGLPAKSNIGARFARTELSVDTLQTVGATARLVNDKNAYTKFLPSANLTVEVTPDFLVRAAASQTLQRASIADLAPSLFFNATNLTVTGGNAGLKPPMSTQADLSFEYYNGKSNLISGAIFTKSVTNFIATFNTQRADTSLDPLGRLLVFSRPENLAKAKVNGFEVGVQQFLDFLPDPFDGLGFIANYTYSDSRDNAGFPLVAVSKNSYNLVALYEKGPVSARLAYNWRDRSLFEFSEGRPSYIGKRSQLDAQIGFDITDQIQVSLQAVNLLPKESATIEYSGTNPLALNSYALSERRYTLGLRAKF